MSFPANVVIVMIASPGDVSDERAVARQVVDDWNRDHAENLGLVLLAIGWDTHSAPELGASPQRIINSQVLARADVLVAIVGSRMGTATADADSGTAEEIDRHAAAGKLAMVYFSDVPVSPSAVDAAQHARVLAFKKSMQDRGLYHTFRSIDSFREDLRRQLHQQIMAKFGAFVRAAPVNAPRTAAAPQAVELTDAAKTVLVHASANGGRMRMLTSFSGTNVSAGGKQLASPKDARSVARWKGAIAALVDASLAQPTNAERTLFELTASGFDEADAVVATGFVPLPSDLNAPGPG